MKKGQIIIVTGGGTGGHLMPAIAMCEQLQENSFRPLLVTDARCEKYLPDKMEFEHFIIDVQRAGNIKKIFHSLCSWTYAIRDSINLIRKEKASIVIGCGGYSSIPLILAALVLRKKIILHEQNAYVGRTNYILSYFADLLFLSFIHTVNIPLIDSKKVIWAGIPITKKHQLGRAVKKSIFSSKEITLLVTGGSQGAFIFDRLIIEALKLLQPKFPEYHFKVIQQVRESTSSSLKEEYSKLHIEAEVANFFHNIEDNYLKADIYIGRSGASTINEIINYKIPSIFVPYPSAQNNHQYYNAMNLVEFNAAWLIEQKDLSAEILSNKLEEIIKKKAAIAEMRGKLAELQMNSTEIIIEEIHKIIDK